VRYRDHCTIKQGLQTRESDSQQNAIAEMATRLSPNGDHTGDVEGKLTHVGTFGLEYLESSLDSARCD
jgi:hypothetical protein